MFHSKRRSIPAIVAGALGVGGVLGVSPAAFADDAADTQALKEQIRLLQTKVEQMESRQQEKAAQQSVDSAVGSAMTEAEKRNNPLSLQAQGFTAGYSNGKFLIQS